MSLGSVSRWPGAALFLAFLAVPALGASLRDPGFESVSADPNDVSTASTAGQAGAWAGWNNWVAPYGAFYTNDAAHSGSQAGKTFSGPNGGIYQWVDVSGTAGGSFEASLWFLNRSSDAMNGAEAADVRVTFYDGPNGTGNALGPAIASTPFTAAAPADVWTQQSVTGTVPAGAVSATYMAFFNNPAGAGGAMYVDDASFTVTAPVPEPAVLGGLAVGATLATLGRRRRRA
jgi:hypothetical protein